MSHFINQEKHDFLVSKFSSLSREWYLLNSKLILDDSLPNNYRIELLIGRQICSALLNVVEDLSHDKCQ